VSHAQAEQNDGNANVPIGSAGGSAPSGPTSATQNAGNIATSVASNDASTNQSNIQTLPDPGSSASHEQDNTVAAQLANQSALTAQLATSQADAGQSAGNANVPISSAGGSAPSGPTSATQNAQNNATSVASNDASTNQSNIQSLLDPGSACTICYGALDVTQIAHQQSAVHQATFSSANAGQNVGNANVPVNVADGNIGDGSDSANQIVSNIARNVSANTARAAQNNAQTGT
jgi:hypothetical protein